jgi:outer membrane protein OmpA-like peptidoglycan-associated protein
VKNLLVIFLTVSSIHPSFCQDFDTLRIYFDKNDAKIKSETSGIINNPVLTTALQNNSDLMIFGYADYLGEYNNNKILSRERAQTVLYYLVKAGFNKKNITTCIGKGEADRVRKNGIDGYPMDRRVDVVVNKSSLRANVNEMMKKDEAGNDRTVAAPAEAALYNDSIEKMINQASHVSRFPIDFSKAKINSIVSFQDIHFVPGQPEIQEISFVVLEELADYLKKNMTISVQIEGHVCCIYNKLKDAPYLNGFLSEYRAKAVYDYLVTHGIEKIRLKYKGLGNLNPLVSPEITENDRVQNRRVDIRILSK